MTRLLDWLAYHLIALGKRHRLALRIEADHADGFAVRYRRGKTPAVSITWTSGTHREQVAFVVSPELAAFIGQGIRESLIEIAPKPARHTEGDYAILSTWGDQHAHVSVHPEDPDYVYDRRTHHPATLGTHPA